MSTHVVDARDAAIRSGRGKRKRRGRWRRQRQRIRRRIGVWHGWRVIVQQAEGADLIIRDLASGTDLTVGSVSEFAFNKPGDRLAWAIDAEDKIGNGISVRDLKTGNVTPIDSGKATYEKVTWNEDGDALAVLKGVEDKAYEDKLYSVVGVSGLTDAASLASAATRKVIFDPATAKDKAFPAGMDAKSNEDEAEKPDLVLWHWKDGRLQSQQQVQEDRDKRFSYLATYRVAEKKFIRLADETVRDVSAPEKGRRAVGIDRRDYELTAALEGRHYRRSDSPASPGRDFRRRTAA